MNEPIASIADFAIDTLCGEWSHGESSSDAVRVANRQSASMPLENRLPVMSNECEIPLVSWFEIPPYVVMTRFAVRNPSLRCGMNALRLFELSGLR